VFHREIWIYAVRVAQAAAPRPDVLCDQDTAGGKDQPKKKKAKLKSVSLDVVVMVMTVLGRVLEVRPSEEDMMGRSK
jgi:hypothetical protein